MLGGDGLVARVCTDTIDKKVEVKQEGRVLNRVPRWTPEVWEVEPDQRHADLIVQEMGMLEARPATTPGKIESKGTHSEPKPLDEKMASGLRSIAARSFQ